MCKWRLPGERWKYYPYSTGHNKYLVSTFGRVISVSPKGKKRWATAYLDDYHGYYEIYVADKTKNGKRFKKSLGTVVLCTFVRKNTVSYELPNFIDLDRSNHRLDNLEWGHLQLSHPDDKIPTEPKLTWS